MRQAGRSLPEYRELRADVGLPMLEACLRPDVAAEATVQPVRRHGVDAGIFFSDIMVPLRLAGVGVEIEPGVGPVLDANLTGILDGIDQLEYNFTDDERMYLAGGAARRSRRVRHRDSGVEPAGQR